MGKWGELCYLYANYDFSEFSARIASFEVLSTNFDIYMVVRETAAVKTSQNRRKEGFHRCYYSKRQVVLNVNSNAVD